MQAKQADFKVLGTVAEVISVAPGLETAIEVALGQGLQYLITLTNPTPKAIAWLKKHQAGRAFLPLNTVSGRTFPKEHRGFGRMKTVWGRRWT